MIDEVLIVHSDGKHEFLGLSSATGLEYQSDYHHLMTDIYKRTLENSEFHPLSNCSEDLSQMRKLPSREADL